MAVRGKPPSYLEAVKEACTRFKTPPLPSLIVVSGTDRYLMNPVIKTVVGAAGGETDPSAVQDGGHTKAAFKKILTQWTTPTLFGGQMVILVDDADWLVKKEYLAELTAIEDPPHLLLLCVKSKPDGRQRGTKALKQSGGLVSLPVLRDSAPPWIDRPKPSDIELHHWICVQAQHRGLRMDLHAASTLFARVGNSPAQLVQKIEQLSILCEGEDVTKEDVEEHILYTSSRLLGLYDDASLRGNLTEALTLAGRMGREGVYDRNNRLVMGPAATDVVLRSWGSRLVRLIGAHEQLTDSAVMALSAKPWERNAADQQALDTVIGTAPSRVFLERDLRSLPSQNAREGLNTIIECLRNARDGAGTSFMTATVRLVRCLHPHQSVKSW